MKRKTTFSLVIDVDILEKLEKISRESGESVSSIIRKAIDEWLNKNESRNL
ncbi:MAG: ribbon-helix-helix protein, CopG family [Nitrososphaeria archaeon]